MLEKRPERQFRSVTEADKALQRAAQQALETGHLAHPPGWWISTELVDLDRAALEPPLTKRLTSEQLEELLEQSLKTGLPCHTQSTERAVKATTEAASQVSGGRRQDSHALNKLARRRRNPAQVVKRTYRTLVPTAAT